MGGQASYAIAAPPLTKIKSKADPNVADEQY
jgi:hypothetical protein